MLKSRETKPRSLIAFKSVGYGDCWPVFRQVATDDAMLYIADSGCCDGNQEVESRKLRVERSQESVVLTLNFGLWTLDFRLSTFATSSFSNLQSKILRFAQDQSAILLAPNFC